MSQDNPWLRDNGWSMTEPFDICWLDCDQPGYLLVSGSKSICLCQAHAIVLQIGCWHGDYAGAPLPPESRATAWPWQGEPVTSAA